MPVKPSYLGMLNAIAVGERRGYKLFSAWAKTTTNPPLATALNRVASRELEHFAAFNKRLNELGFTIRSNKSKTHKKQLKLMKSDIEDTEKFAAILNFSAATAAAESPDPFEKIFSDQTIDPITGALLGRFIAEERLSLTELRSCWQSLQVDTEVGTETMELDAIKERLERLTNTLEELKSLRGSV